MKTKCFMIASLFLVSTFIYGQELKESEVKVPEPPAKPEFNFDFQYFGQMSESDEKELLKNLNKDIQKQLETIKKVNKNKYFEFLRESQFKSIKLPFIVKHEKDMHERERKIFEAEIKTESLAAEYEQAKENDKARIREELRKELTNLFEQKEERRKSEVEQLENELKELRQSLAARQKNKKTIIDRRLQELLDEEQYLDWD